MGKSNFFDFTQHTTFKVFQGAPKPTSTYDVAALQRMDYIGVYTYDPEPEPVEI